jgi:hypothetical protein
LCRVSLNADGMLNTPIFGCTNFTAEEPAFHALNTVSGVAVQALAAEDSAAAEHSYEWPLAAMLLCFRARIIFELRLLLPPSRSVFG